MKRKNVSLVVGADGLIGRALADYLSSAGESVIETTRRLDTISERRVLLDLAGDISGWQLPCQVSVAYLCAAMSKVDDCRRHPKQSEIVNVRNIVALAKALVASGTFVIFLSTTLVYDGSVPFRKENDPVCPITAYGLQKAEAEKELLALGNLVAVVRLSKVLSPKTPLVKEWILALLNKKPIYVFFDKVMSPIPLSFVIDVLHRIAEARLSGIVHVSGNIDVTYEQVARYIAQRIGVSQDLIYPMAARKSGLQSEDVPLHTALGTTRLRNELGIEPPDIWVAIDSVLDI